MQLTFGKIIAILIGTVLIVLLFSFPIRRFTGIFTLLTGVAVIFICVPDAASDYMRLGGNSYSGGPGSQIAAAVGWLLLIAVAIIVISVRFYLWQQLS